MQPICVTLQPGPGDNLTAALSTRKPEASSGCTPSLVRITLARPHSTHKQPCGPECQTPSSQSLCKPPVACVPSAPPRAGLPLHTEPPSADCLLPVCTPGYGLLFAQQLQTKLVNVIATWWPNHTFSNKAEPLPSMSFLGHSLSSTVPRTISL